MKKYRLLDGCGYDKLFKDHIYNEDFMPAGTRYPVSKLVEKYPKDWELVKVDTRFPFALTMGKAKEIMAVVCPEWQEKLGKLWGKSLLIYGYVEVDEALYKEGRKVATEKVNKLLDEIFGKDEQKITYEDVMDSFETIYYIEKSGNINSRGGYGLGSDGRNDPNNTYSANIHKRQQAQLKLANVAKHLNKDKIDQGFFIYLRDGKIGYGVCTSSIGEPVVYFKTRDLAEQAIEILGEETVKLACQPLND